MSSNYVVFWLEDNVPQSCRTDDMGEMLTIAANKRKEQKDCGLHSNLPKIEHVCTSSEHSDMVGEFGVSAPDASYDWKKRRK